MLKSRDQIWVRDGRTLTLGASLGHGGEGAVYELVEDPLLVAKIYNKPVNPTQHHKLETLIELADPKVTEMAAWPSMIVRGVGRSSSTVGFTMRKLTSYRPIHELFSPRSRRLKFPEMDFGELLKVAHNLAVAIHRVHEKGCVIGDINESNVLVNAAGEVRLIDCDSIQVPSSNSDPHLCRVGVPGFTPPELQIGANFDKNPRTVNHDGFGLAVMIFQLLFLGRHPFAGTPTQRDYTLAEAIAGNRLAYGKGAHERGLVRPKGIPIPDLDFVGPLMSRMFEVAFLDLGQSRPKPVEWTKAIKKLHENLAVCEDEAGHLYPKHSTSCPWCPFELAVSAPVFPMRGPKSQHQEFDIDEFEKSLAQAQILPQYPMPPQPMPAPDILKAKRADDVRGFMGVGLVVGAYFLATVVAVTSTWMTFALSVIFWVVGALIAATRLDRYLAAKMAPVMAIERQIVIAKQDLDRKWSGRTLAAAVLDTQTAIRAFRELPTVYQMKVKERESQAREIQLQEHLGRFAISDDYIPNFGDSRKATLRAYGIHTAWDVHALKEMPDMYGIKSSLWWDLGWWKDECAKSFTYDAKKGLTPGDLIGIKREVERQKTLLIAQMKKWLMQVKSHRDQEAESIRSRIKKLEGLIADREDQLKKLNWWFELSQSGRFKAVAPTSSKAPPAASLNPSSAQPRPKVAPPLVATTFKRTPALARKMFLGWPITIAIPAAIGVYYLWSDKPPEVAVNTAPAITITAEPPVSLPAPIPAGPISPAPFEYPAPQPVPAVAQTYTPPPIEARSVISGPVDGISPSGYPMVNGHEVKLYGIGDVAQQAREMFAGWIKTHDEWLTCSPVNSNEYQCLTASNLDAAAALLLNGAVATSSTSSDAYRALEAQAQVQRRGIWN